MLPVRADVREAIGKQAGDTVTVHLKTHRSLTHCSFITSPATRP
jgi:hypothetical protein